MFSKRILEVLKENGPMTSKDLRKRLAVNRELGKELRKVLGELEDSGEIFQTRRGKYSAVDGEKFVTGEIQIHPKGFGFLLQPQGDDVFVEQRKLGGAYHGDTVLLRIEGAGGKEGKPYGRIVKVISRGTKVSVGIYSKEGKDFGFVTLDDKKFPQDIFIMGKNDKGAKSGEKVVVKIIKYPEKGSKRSPEGKIIEVLGDPETKEVQILSVARTMGFPMDFSKKAMAEARSIPQTVSGKEIGKRRDLRDLLTFTIDGADSKDFDDAISIEEKDNGNVLLGVHIADVAHYVQAGSFLDKEAFERGNSVYLLDQVIPMLPFPLSNGICSLNEGVDRLTLTVFMEVDQNGSVVRHEIVESVIRSNRRLVYTHVSDFLEKNQMHRSIQGLEKPLETLGKFAKILEKKRRDRGSLDFNLPERKIVLDPQGKVKSVEPGERRTANRLIEECMLLANETVAEHYHWLDVPFLYRIHEDPTEEKLNTLNGIIRPFGHRIRHVNDIRPMEIQQLLSSISGEPEAPLVETMILRSLQKARYSSELEEHFGLASHYYTHFTSPIRRYADLTIHRIIKASLQGPLGRKREGEWKKTLPGIAEHISATEKMAKEAERKVEDMKLAEYMKEFIGKEFNGIVSGVTSFGIFVALENTVEGLAPYRTMEDFVRFDGENLQAIFRNRKEPLSMGDRVRIVVENTNPLLGQIDFQLVM